MSAAAAPGSTGYDWQSLYDGLLTRGGIPLAAEQTITHSQATFRGLLVDFEQAYHAVAHTVAAPLVTSIFADVVTVPASFVWPVQQGALVVVARLIQAGDDAGVMLDLADDTTTTAIVFADEISGGLSVTATTGVTPADRASFTLDAAPPSGGTQFHFDGAAPVATPRTRAQGIAMSPTPSFRQALATTFIAASLLYDEHPHLAVAQLGWVAHWSAVSPDLASLLFRSSALLALLQGQLAAQGAGASFVPFLSADVYQELAQSFVSEAAEYEQSYDQLRTCQTVDDDFRRYARTLLANEIYETDYAKALLKQAGSNYDNAVEAVTIAETSLAKARHDAAQVQIDFRNKGVPEWEEAKILDAVVSLGTAVVTFAVGIAGTLVGDPAGAAGAAQGATEAASAAAKAAKTGGEIAGTAEKVAESAEQLKQTAESLTKLYELSKAVIEASRLMADSASFAAQIEDLPTLAAPDLTSSAADWRAYQLAADNVLADPISQGVRYAEDLKQAVDTVVVYGQALVAAQLAAVVAGQQYAAAKLRAGLAAQEQAQLKTWVGQLEDQTAIDADLLQALFQRYLDAKESLFAAIQSYRASYFYWALDSSQVSVRVSDDVRALNEGLQSLTGIQFDKQRAWNRFDPPPQEMTGRGKQVVVKDGAFLAALKTDGVASVLVPLDHPEFDGWDRVRLTTVRVWLEGLKVPADSKINVRLSTSGQYQDRFGSESFRFQTKPLMRGFEYTVAGKQSTTHDWQFEDGSFGSLDIDGTVDQEVAYAYFEPTPFTQWTIDLTEIQHRDASRVTKATLVFFGSAIQQRGNHGADAR